MPRFSIIVPVYNVAPYLRECLDSVCRQSLTDWECICVDDGSTDGSDLILDEYATKDPRFRGIHQPNGGEGAARNAGLAVARGEWIVFLDGDDLLSSDALRRIGEVVAADVEIIRFDFSTFQDSELPTFESARAGKHRDVDISRKIDMSEFFAYVWQHAYRRKTIAGMQFTRYKRGCDRVFFDDVLLNHVSSVRILDASLYGYRQRPGSAMNTQPSMQVLLDEMDHRLDIIRMIDASGKSVSYARSVWLEGYFTRGFPAIAGRRKEERKELIAAWRERMAILGNACGLSRRGNRLAHLAANRATFPLAWMLCYWMPRIRLSIRYRIQIVRRRLFGKK